MTGGTTEEGYGRHKVVGSFRMRWIITHMDDSESCSWLLILIGTKRGHLQESDRKSHFPCPPAHLNIFTAVSSSCLSKVWINDRQVSLPFLPSFVLGDDVTTLERRNSAAKERHLHTRAGVISWALQNFWAGVYMYYNNDDNECFN